MFKSRYARFMFAPDTGADGGTAVETTATETVEETTPDYKAMYNKQKADYDRLKSSFDKTASEVAELKKANKAKMSEDEQRAVELAEREQRYTEAVNQLNEIKTSNVFAKAGFDESDYTDLSKKIVEVGGDKANELAETVVEFVKKANKAAIASAKNGLIKDSAIPPKASTETADEHIYATMATKNNNPNTRVNEIKDFYRQK